MSDEQKGAIAMVNTRIRELLLAIPKVELHLHLEAALTLTTLYEHLQPGGTAPADSCGEESIKAGAGER
ncbi:MAG: hypothetical protein AB9903_15065 [Vulcanimicrobiota bacterium]